MQLIVINYWNSVINCDLKKKKIVWVPLYILIYYNIIFLLAAFE